MTRRGDTVEAPARLSSGMACARSVSAAGVTVKDARSQVAALGPAVSFFELGSGWPLIWAHAYKEFDARNRSQGTHVALRAAWTF